MAISRLWSFGLLVAALAGCTAQDAGPAPMAAPVQTMASPAALSSPAEPTRSPAPDMRASGEGWRIDLKADQGLRYTARLQRSGASLNATLMLRAATPAVDPSHLIFDGTLFAPGADTPLRLDITRENCRVGHGKVQTHTIVVSVQGAAPLHGCGENTSY